MLEVSLGCNLLGTLFKWFFMLQKLVDVMCLMGEVLDEDVTDGHHAKEGMDVRAVLAGSPVMNLVDLGWVGVSTSIHALLA